MAFSLSTVRIVADSRAVFALSRRGDLYTPRNTLEGNAFLFFATFLCLGVTAGVPRRRFSRLDFSSGVKLSSDLSPSLTTDFGLPLFFDVLPLRLRPLRRLTHPQKHSPG